MSKDALSMHAMKFDGFGLGFACRLESAIIGKGPYRVCGSTTTRVCASTADVKAHDNALHTM